MSNTSLKLFHTVWSSLPATDRSTYVRSLIVGARLIFRHHLDRYSWVVSLANRLRLHPSRSLYACAILSTVIQTLLAKSPTQPVSLRSLVTMLSGWFISPLVGSCLVARLIVLSVKWWMNKTPLTWIQEAQTEDILLMRTQADSEPELPPVILPQQSAVAIANVPVAIPPVDVVDDEEPEWFPAPSTAPSVVGEDDESEVDLIVEEEDDAVYNMVIVHNIASSVSSDSVQPEDDTDTVDGSEDSVDDVPTRPRDVDEELPVDFVPNRHYIGWLMGEVKVQFGCPNPSVANRLMVRRWVRDKMRERKMRVTHQRHWLDKITNSVFLPSVEDIVSREMLMSRAARKLIRRYTSPLYTWWGLCVPEPFHLE